MDPRFRRNHQLHVLLKRRTYISDHELYEMMRSTHVYRAQHELRRELDTTLKSIVQAQKERIASFTLERASFIKMLVARQKSLRHLVDVKRELGDADSRIDDAERFAQIDDFDGDDETVVWNPNFVHENGTGRVEHFEHLVHVSSDDHTLLLRRNQMDSSMDNEAKQQKSRKQLHKRTDAGSLKQKDLNSSLPHVEKETFKTETKTELKHSQHYAETDNAKSQHQTLPKIEINSRSESRASTQSPAYSDQGSSRSANGLVLPEIFSSRDSQHRLKRDSKVLDLPLDSREREVTVDMLFVEGDNNKEVDPIAVSLFDLEACLKQYRSKQKQGHTVIVNSSYLHQVDDEPTSNDLFERSPAKVRFSVEKPPVLCHTWGATPKEAMSPRERSKQWYEHFVETKNSRRPGIKHNDVSKKPQCVTSFSFSKAASNDYTQMTPLSLKYSSNSKRNEQFQLYLQKQYGHALRKKVVHFISS